MKPGQHERFAESQSFQRVAGPEAARGVAFKAAPARPVPSGVSAVVVVHGMGQQIPFETLDSVVEGLLRVDGSPAGGRERSNATVRMAHVGGTDLPRAELDLHAADGSSKRVHLYEAYWAPLTEGRVQLRDVIRFLSGGALNGVRNARTKRGFSRWMFGGWVRFPSPPSTRWSLLLAAVVLWSLVLINAVTTAIFASAVLHQTGSAWVGPGVIADSTLVVAALLGGVALLMLLLFVTRWMGAFIGALLLIVVAAVALVAVVAAYAFTRTAIWPSATNGWPGNPWVVGALWTALAAASWWVRGKLVQYVGDVAAYVAPQDLDRFAGLRQKIKDTVGAVVNAVYRHGADGSAPPYDRVAIVGHSLGSVAAYDALNAAINADRLDAAGAWRVVDRTCLLLTFGSPLDKTAFIFKAQGHHTGETREALAAAVQPLIQDYAFRTFPWVNVWSPADIISGPLDLYDDTRKTESRERFVENKQDPDAVTPLAAHTEYWDNALVFTQLHGRLT